jgi:hypothetical protein
MGATSDKLMKLRPVTFRYKGRTLLGKDFTGLCSNTV